MSKRVNNKRGKKWHNSLKDRHHRNKCLVKDHNRRMKQYAMMLALTL